MTRTCKIRPALFLCAGLLVPAVWGCAAIERETGLDMPTQQGIGIGAGLGGIIAAIAGANPGWIAASAILGGAAGGIIGNHLGKDDAERHAQTNLRALDTLGAGQRETWSDSKSGNSGSTAVTKVARASDGAVCKSFRETVKAGTRTTTQEATACKRGGTWRVQA